MSDQYNLRKVIEYIGGEPVVKMVKGDLPGHEFHGNQYTGEGGPNPKGRDDKPQLPRGFSPIPRWNRAELKYHAKKTTEARAREIVASLIAQAEKYKADGDVMMRMAAEDQAENYKRLLEYMANPKKFDDADDFVKGDLPGHEFHGNQYQPGQSVRFEGRSADGKIEGSMDVKIVNPHSNSAKVVFSTGKGKSFRQYEASGARHLPTATVERPARGGFPARQFEAYHHTLRTAKTEQSEDLSKRDFSAKEREHDAKTGVAMPGGGFPIENASDLRNAIRAIGRAKDPEAARAHIKARAKVLGLESELPDAWKT